MRIIGDDALAIITILAEAEGEPYQGKVAVGEVIRNRAARRYDSDGTIAGTVAARYQFSFFNDDRMDNLRLIKCLQADDSDQAVQDCVRAWAASAGTSLTSGAVLYFNPAEAAPSWAATSTFLVQIGNHQFFK